MSDSDVEIKRPMKPVKQPPKSPTEELLKAQEKKITTKAMIHEALKDLKTRKGVSIQAIKKYMEDKYNVETDKVKYLIKKTLKTGVEDGSIVQVKGIGASGSFKLAAVKEKPKGKPKPKKEKPKEEKSTKEKSKEKPIKEKSLKEKTKTDKMKTDKIKTDKIKTVKQVKLDVQDKEKKTKKPKEKKAESKEKNKGKNTTTPVKKKSAMMKRKSIGSIIKPPKMKPKSKA